MPPPPSRRKGADLWLLAADDDHSVRVKGIDYMLYLLYLRIRDNANWLDAVDIAGERGPPFELDPRPD